MYFVTLIIEIRIWRIKEFQQFKQMLTNHKIIDFYHLKLELIQGIYKYIYVLYGYISQGINESNFSLFLGENVFDR